MARKRQLQLSKEHYEFLRSYFSEDLKLNREETNVMIDLYKNGVIDSGLITDLELGSIDDSISAEIKVIRKLFQSPNVTLVSYLLKQLPSTRRKNIMEMYDLSPMERYIYNTIVNAKKENRKITTEKILLMLEKYKNIKMTEKNLRYYKSVIMKIRRKIYYKEGRKKKESEE